MKNKEIISILVLIGIFAILTFATPYIENRTASYLWISFFMLVAVLMMIGIIASIAKNQNEILERFANQHVLVKILDVVFILVLLYGIMTLNVISITWILIILIALIPICKWFLKKRKVKIN